jgi:hypothetical protein
MVEAAPTKPGMQMTSRESVNFARRMLNKGKLDQADLWTQALVNQRPGDIRILLSRAFALQRLCRPIEAARMFRKAAIIDPGLTQLWSNIGNAERYVGRLEVATRAHIRAMLLRPGNKDAAFGFAIDQLARGDYLTGFRAYERRVPKVELQEKLEKRGGEIWTNQPIAGRQVLLIAEQGAGDTIQFARFARTLADRGAEVSVACGPNLGRLISGVDGVARTVHGVERESEFIDLLMSIPARLGTTLENLPAPRRYLTPPEAPLLLPQGQGPKIGLVWAGNPSHQRDPWRSIPVETFRPLLSIPDATFFSFQVAAPEDNRLPSEWADRLTDLEPHIKDFGDTAALVDQMDLVVTIDSSVAHVAGALGVPCWVLLSYVTDWRWLHDRSESPWYPSVRLVRQVNPGDWDGVIQRVVHGIRAALQSSDLQRFASGPPSR